MNKSSELIKSKLDECGIKSDLPWKACVSCAVRRYTVLNRLHEVTWCRRQPKKWVVVIGLLCALVGSEKVFNIV